MQSVVAHAEWHNKYVLLIAHINKQSLTMHKGRTVYKLYAVSLFNKATNTWQGAFSNSSDQWKTRERNRATVLFKNLTSIYLQQGLMSLSLRFEEPQFISLHLQLQIIVQVKEGQFQYIEIWLENILLYRTQQLCRSKRGSSNSWPIIETNLVGELRSFCRLSASS